MKFFRFIPQHDKMDCGPACVAMVSTYYGNEYPLDYIRQKAFLTKEGVSMAGIIEASQKIGFKTLPIRATLSLFCDKSLPLPAIIHWNHNHFVVLIKVKRKIFHREYKFLIADPAHGIIWLKKENFQNSLENNEKGVALLLSPTQDFYNTNAECLKQKKSFRYLFSYLKPHLRQLVFLFSLLLIGACISLALPFLTQNLMDKGVSKKDFNYVTLVLIAQLALFMGSLLIDFFRNWITLVIGTRININIISDFFKKLLKLPLKFFDTRFMGDFNQRIADHERIERFLTSQSLQTFFSFLMFSVFFGVLYYYDNKILLIYLGLTAISIIWSLFWLAKRKALDYFRFQQRSENQQIIYEMIGGITEMKLNKFENYKIKQWENIQNKLFRVNIRILKLEQIQVLGFESCNQLKNILVTFIAASLVIKGVMSIGSLLAVSFIIGQMNAPINQLMAFFKSLQDAKLSMGRLNEMQYQPEEDILLDDANNVSNLYPTTGFSIESASFQYSGPRSPFVLNNITAKVALGQVTAIVGSSGSGKTTLMKLLLKFYEPVMGNIFLGGNPLSKIPHTWLREKSGVVMQDGFIFGDTIERNIVCGDEQIDKKKLERALWISNLDDFVNSLPLKLHTKIGTAGNGISGGQRQRILIARAVYKNPDFLFFDEATSSLDAENEKIIHTRLQSFFKGRTVIIIAHRLSTVKNADQIIVLKEGRIAEQGTHQHLVGVKGVYYNLVKNQLELGS
ncbi:MAG: peptidase domain-containing ABC transporter [Niabella sp.]